MMDFFSHIFSEYLWYVALTHFALATILFFIVNWIGARSISVGYMQLNVVIQEDTAPAFNFVFKVIAPVVFIVLCAVTFEALDLNSFKINIYFIVIFYWLVRLIWVLCSSRASLMNWVEQIIYWIASIGLSIWVYHLMEDVAQILPSPRSLLDQLWILIIVFLYSILNTVQFSRAGTITRKNNYISSRYKTFRKKYNTIIHAFLQNDFYEALTYSIMIYEDFNRPIVVRWVEYLRFWITRKPHTLGIMQVTTNKYINDKDSIILAMQQISSNNNDIMERYADSPFPSINRVAYLIAKKYNSGDYDYAYEVGEIFEQIVSTFYEPMPDSYEEIKRIVTNDSSPKK